MSAMEDPEYLQAYLDGMQFALLAIEGRVHQMPVFDRDALLGVLEEYHLMATEFRDRGSVWKIAEKPVP
ncbi:MAG: hypothetical protein ACT4PT_05775 [Methanobacteriota archaeon]